VAKTATTSISAAAYTVRVYTTTNTTAALFVIPPRNWQSVPLRCHCRWKSLVIHSTNPLNCTTTATPATTTTDNCSVSKSLIITTITTADDYLRACTRLASFQSHVLLEDELCFLLQNLIRVVQVTSVVGICVWVDAPQHTLESLDQCVECVVMAVEIEVIREVALEKKARFMT
jgi:hypothetical protein